MYGPSGIPGAHAKNPMALINVSSNENNKLGCNVRNQTVKKSVHSNIVVQVGIDGLHDLFHQLHDFI